MGEPGVIRLICRGLPAAFFDEIPHIGIEGFFVKQFIFLGQLWNTGLSQADGVAVFDNLAQQLAVVGFGMRLH